MKNLVLILIATTAVFSLNLQAGGYAGNGGGLVEQNFSFAYSSLPRIVASSLTTIPMQFSASEKATLQKISAIATQNVSNAKRMVFLSGQKHPEIFNTSPGELHRLAVTTLIPGDIIYVNGDLLYSDQGQPTLNLGEIISILTHEVGHQTGEIDHQFLDILGAKLRNFHNQNSMSYEMNKGTENLVFTILNQKSTFSSGQLLFQNNSKVVNLTPGIHEKILAKMKSAGYQNLTGFFLTNGNYKLEHIPLRYIFQVWVNGNFTLKIEKGYTSKNDLFPVEFEVGDDNIVRLIP